MELNPEQLILFFEEDDLEVMEAERLYITGKCDRIMDRLAEIDGLLNEKTEKWTTDRMGRAELTILRLAVYEILFDEDVPTGVAINEAVELAKKFGQDGAGAFVNVVVLSYPFSMNNRCDTSNILSTVISGYLLRAMYLPPSISFVWMMVERQLRAL